METANKKVKLSPEVCDEVQKEVVEAEKVDDEAQKLTDKIMGEQEERKEIAFNEKRVKVLKENKAWLEGGECEGVVYWMARDQRVQDNWALIYAQQLATKHQLPLHVVFCLPSNLPHATTRRCHFLFSGLKEVETECRALNIGFHLLKGSGGDVLPGFVAENKCACIVADMSPLYFFRDQLDVVSKTLPSESCLYQVDAHNVIPVWETSEKAEYAARTIRPKIHKQVDEYLTEFPLVEKHSVELKKEIEPVDWDAASATLTIDDSVSVATKFQPGTANGLKFVSKFLEEGLKGYDKDRNNPNVDDGASNLSPWINFGQISAQRIVLMARKSKNNSTGFVEELLVRRELADNFCYYQPNYNSIEGCTNWAKQTLEAHRKDKREWVYTKQQLEEAKTHDDLWNAAQLQMVKHGKMHGFLRMYWAKKILEWTASPEEALEISLYLNDHYELDGCDPNGVTGCMWSICGVHDTAWTEREVFGKVRYMNYKGCMRKFDVKGFVAKYQAV